MRKEQVIGYIRSCIEERKITVKYQFDAEHLPAVIRLKGKEEDGYIDVPLSRYKKKLLGLRSGNDLLTIGRLPLCDIQVDHYEDNLISRIHVIWQKKGDEFLLINCGIYGTVAFEETADGLKEIPSQDEPWSDFEEK